MEKEAISRFQEKVSESLLRHRSILDSLTKFQESAGRVNRAIAKSVTGCGCISIAASRQVGPPEADIRTCKDYMQTHVHGHLCEHCQEILSEELGNHLIYLAALCHLLDMDLGEIFTEEYQRLSALGLFHLS